MSTSDPPKEPQIPSNFRPFNPFTGGDTPFKPYATVIPMNSDQEYYPEELQRNDEENIFDMLQGVPLNIPITRIPSPAYVTQQQSQIDPSIALILQTMQMQFKSSQEQTAKLVSAIVESKMKRPPTLPMIRGNRHIEQDLR